MMRRLFPWVSALLLVLAGPAGSVTWASPPVPDSAVDAAPTPLTPEDALERGLSLERARNWAGAIEAYHAALERWPSRVDFSRRLRLCEIHFKVSRRYLDTSFRNVLLRLPQEQAIDLYDEVVERIQTNYVDPVPLEPLVRHGLDNLEVALRDPVFVKTNAPAANPEQVDWLRDTLRQYRAQLNVPDRASAIRLALVSSEAARASIGMASTPVLLEFTCGACDALDDFTSCLTPDKLEDLYAMIDGNFVGLGVELKMNKEGLLLVGVIRGGPAWEAGMKAGETIVKIGDRSIKGLGLDEAANRLQGGEGTTLDLEVKRRDGTVRALRLVRRHVDVESVAKAAMIEPAEGIGYLRLTGFQKTSADEIDTALRHAFQARNEGIGAGSQRKPRRLTQHRRRDRRAVHRLGPDCLDPRAGPGANPGALRQRPGSMANADVCVGRPRQRQRQRDLGRRSPGSSAGHDRGARTYGKGSVQSIFSLRSAPAGLKLTTAKFYSPLNRPYSEQGVQPDLPIKLRTAAKPAGDGATPSEEATIGDPQLDVVLAAAIRTAKSQLHAAR